MWRLKKTLRADLPKHVLSKSKYWLKIFNFRQFFRSKRLIQFKKHVKS